MNQCTIVWCQRVSKITTDGRHAYHFRAGWPVGTAWASLGSGQHWFTITLVISVDWKNSKKARNIVFVPLERFAVVWAQNLDSKRNTCASSQFCQNTKKKEKRKENIADCFLEFLFEAKVEVKVRFNFLWRNGCFAGKRSSWLIALLSVCPDHEDKEWTE